MSSLELIQESVSCCLLRPLLKTRDTKRRMQNWEITMYEIYWNREGPFIWHLSSDGHQKSFKNNVILIPPPHWLIFFTLFFKRLLMAVAWQISDERALAISINSIYSNLPILYTSLSICLFKFVCTNNLFLYICVCVCVCVNWLWSKAT